MSRLKRHLNHTLKQSRKTLFNSTQFTKTKDKFDGVYTKKLKVPMPPIRDGVDRRSHTQCQFNKIMPKAKQAVSLTSKHSPTNRQDIRPLISVSTCGVKNV